MKKQYKYIENMKRRRNIYSKPAMATFGRLEMPKVICTLSGVTEPFDPGGPGGDAKPFDNSSFFFTDNEQNAKEQKK
jgi:hypothetical protein